MTTTTDLSAQAQAYLHKLCVEIPNRSVGSRGNQAATAYFADIAAAFGFEIETLAFDCLDWESDGVRLMAGTDSFAAFASPYSLGCQVTADLAAVATVAALEAANVADKILLLHGEIARQQIMPKNFPFYNPDEHQHIIRLLETKKPLAIIAATARDVEMVGSMYPFPLFEDGDFDIPSVYMTDVEGQRLAAQVGKSVTLDSRARRIPSTGCNVIARKTAQAQRRVVLFAHIDAKKGTPGALDNAGSVVVLLLLTELLKDYTGDPGIEIVALNGEDYFSNPGEQQYLASNTSKFDEIVLGINIDGVGYHRGDTAFSLYDCPPQIAQMIQAVFSRHTGLVEGEQWVQGDHMLFLLNQRPALAFTSQHALELLTEIIHTDKDTPDIVDVTRLVQIAKALRDLLIKLADNVA